MKKILLILLCSAFVYGIQAQATVPKMLDEYSIPFGWNKWELTPTVRTELSAFLKQIKSYPKATISIVGWADNTGSFSANQTVTLRRAQNVSNFLQQNGISSESITIEGKGVDPRKNHATARRADIFVTVYVVAAQPEPVPEPVPVPEPEPVPVPEPEPQVTIVEPTPEVVVAQVEPPMVPESKLIRWGVGANIGISLFWGDMSSISADKTYIGISAGLQGSYRISKLLGVSLSADWARGKIGAKEYSKGYQLEPDAMTYYFRQEMSKPYAELYSKISVVSIGASLDVNINRIFSVNADRHRFTVWVSPTLYGQFFRAGVYTKEGDEKFTDDTLKPSAISLGLGGSLSLRYRVCKNIELQLKNSLIWVTDNNFDGIATPFSKTTKQNAMWTPQIGLIWNIK